MRIINNQDQIAEQISRRFNLDAIGDDGNVCINNQNVPSNIVSQIREQFGHLRVGDGVQEGSIFINGEELN